MADTGIEDKAIRVITFSGKSSEWSVWETKFLAKANRAGYKKILLGKDVPPSDDEVLDESDDDGKAKMALRKANERAFEELLLSIDGNSKTGRTAFNLVKLSKTKELTNGDAALAWKKLSQKYATKSISALLALKEEFTNSKLGKKADPEEWITNLEDLRIQMELQDYDGMSDTDFFMHILNNVPGDYEIVVNDLEKRLGDKNDPLTTEEIQTRLRTKFQKMYPKATSSNDDGDVGLFAGGFKGNCNHCGKQGHKAFKCPEKSNTEKGKGNGNNNNGKG